MRHHIFILTCLQKELGDLGELVWVKKQKTTCCFYHKALQVILSQLTGMNWLMWV